MKLGSCKTAGNWWKWREHKGKQAGTVTIIGEPEKRQGMFGPQEVVSVYDWLGEEGNEVKRMSLGTALKIGITEWGESAELGEDTDLAEYRLALTKTGTGTKTRVTVKGEKLTPDEIETVHAGMVDDVGF